MRSVVVAAMLIAAGSWPAAAHAGKWLTDPTSACAVWDPLPVPDQTIGWRGGCEDGKASGFGVLTIFRKGQVVERDEGEFVAGKQTGPGTRQYPDGRYAGNFTDGLFDGKGLYVSSDGMRYDGEWKNGNLEGHGKLSFASGLRYEGQFRANSYSGLGSMILPNGDRYNGEYLLNTPHGTGTYRKVDGSIYAGQWRHGCFNDGDRTAHLGVFAEDCGLAEAPSIALAPSDTRESREN